ncbi:MAG: hypothetical protein KDA65_12730 [Planctomycetaceae bacterium]|nr:hypothetical protein [Planctomycetaceae bacterium]
MKKIRREGVLSENEYAVAKNKLINEYNSDVKAMEMAQGHVSSIEQVSHEQTTDRSNAQTNFISTQPAVSIPLGDLNPLNESTP